MTTSDLRLFQPNDVDWHGPIEERLSHAHHSAELLLEYLDQFASELHSDFRAHFWERLQTHIKRRIENVTQKECKERRAP